MALPDLTGQNIENTYQRVIQTDGTNFYDGTGSLVNFGGAVFPYTGSAIISGSLIVTGSTEIQYLTASGLNYPTIDGDEKQLITTDGSGNLSFDWSDRTNLDVKNTSGTTLALGTPVYISGFQGASIFQIAPSSASISSSMPAVGVLSQELAPNEQGHATILGALRGYNTSLCSVNDSLYVGEGILTKDRPTGSALIQKIARVGNSQNNGEITIIGAGRSNDIPNLPPGYAWIGNDNWVATAVPTSSFNEDPFPYTGSAAISGALEVTGDVTIYGTASVNVLITNYESSSIIYSSGSTKFGDSLDDTHIFTGSVSVTGSLDVDNTITAVTGSFSHLKGNSPITIQDPVTFQSDITGSGKISLNYLNGTHTVIGNGAGSVLSSGNGSTFIGYQAGKSSTGPTDGQTLIGYRAGDGLTSGAPGAVMVGYNADGKTNGSWMVGIGNSAYVRNSAGVAIGSSTRAGFYDVSLGYQTGRNAATSYTVSIGRTTGQNAGGNYHILIGDQAGYFIAGTGNNTIGRNAGISLNGNYNNVLGFNAGANIIGNDNTALGSYAGYNASGSNNILLGYQAGYDLTGSNQLIIANNSSSALVTGDFANNTFNISGSVSASTYYGDGSNLTGIETDPFPYTGSAVISGSLTVTGSISSTDTVTAVTGSFSHLKGNSPITVQDPVTFQHEQGLSVVGNATINSINEVDLQTISKDFNYTSSLNVAEITASVNGAIIDYRLTNLNSGSRVGTFMYAHDGTELSYNDLTIPGGGIGSQPILSATLTGSIVSIDIENAQGFNFTGYAKKFNRLDSPVPIPNPNATYPLDAYTGAAVAFSTRQLSDPNVGYTGSCMRVREDGSNTEADINFGVDGLLDAVALASHCGSNNGYVVTWYDQSGNGNDASNSTLTRQPKIYDGSTGILKNSNNIPYVQTNATNGTSDSHLVISSTAFGSVYWAGLKANSDDCISSLGWNLPGGGTRVIVQGTNFHFSDVNLQSQDVIFGGIISGSNSRVTVNTETVTGSVASIPNQSIILGRGDGSRGLIKTYELMVWNSAQTIATDEGLREDMNNHYNFYDDSLLANYPGATAAYSVRQLDSAYTGSALRIREDGTNTETDIGFDSNGDLDTASIASHCGANNGLVVTWYDQSGNGNNATQNTTTKQPKIYDSVTGMVTEGSAGNEKPAVEFNSTSATHLSYIDSYSGTKADFSIYSVARHNGLVTDTKRTYWAEGTSMVWGPSTRSFPNATVNINMTQAVNGAQELRGASFTLSPANYVGSINGAIDVSGTGTWTSITRSSSGNIGSRSNGSWSLNGNIQEIVVYQSDQSANRTGIENNINSYFNIY